MTPIDYTQVSKGQQTLEPWRGELRAAGCAIIHEEQASAADVARPDLARILATRSGQVSLSLAKIPSSPATRQDRELDLGPSSIVNVISIKPLEQMSGRTEQRAASLQAAILRQYVEPAQSG